VSQVKIHLVDQANAELGLLGLARAARATWRPFRICQIDRAVGALAGKIGC
jgi:hypothetical protein